MGYAVDIDVPDDFESLDGFDVPARYVARIGEHVMWLTSDEAMATGHFGVMAGADAGDERA